MAQIEVEAAAHVIGLQVGERGRFEDTPFLRGAIRSGVLRLVEDPAPRLEMSVGRHPAGKRRPPEAAETEAAETAEAEAEAGV